MMVEQLVNRSITPELFNMLLKAVEHVRLQYGLSDRREVIPLMQQLYNVTINEMTKLSDGTNVHIVRWDSEQSYTWFLLRWS